MLVGGESQCWDIDCGITVDNWGFIQPRWEQTNLMTWCLKKQHSLVQKIMFPIEIAIQGYIYIYHDISPVSGEKHVSLMDFHLGLCAMNQDMKLLVNPSRLPSGKQTWRHGQCPGKSSENHRHKRTSEKQEISIVRLDYQRAATI